MLPWIPSNLFEPITVTSLRRAEVRVAFTPCLSIHLAPACVHSHRLGEDSDGLIRIQKNLFS